MPAVGRVTARHQRRPPSATPTPRLALSPREAADCLGCSRDFFDEHVLPELRVVRKGRKVLISIQELERWLTREGALTLEVHR
jgi:excisionase family DNA binding protein